MTRGTRRFLAGCFARLRASRYDYGLGILLCLTVGAGSSESAQRTSKWVDAVSGVWYDVTKWSTGTFPRNGFHTYAVVIDATGSPYTVDLLSPVTIDSLTLNSPDATFALNSWLGDLRVLGTFELQAGTFAVLGGKITGGTIHGTGGSMEVPSSAERAIFDGVTLDTDLILKHSLVVTNGLRLGANRTIRIMEGRDPVGVEFSGSQTLDGAGEFLSDPGSSFSVYADSGTTLTIGPDIVVRSQNANVRFGSVWVPDGVIINQGLISAEINDELAFVALGGTFENQGVVQAVNGGRVDLEGNWTNRGILRVDGGTLDLDADFTSADIGTIDFISGKIRIAGTFHNTGTLNIDNSTGSIELVDGGTIVGGAVVGADGRSLIVKRGTLDGVFLGADTRIDSYLAVRNGLTLDDSTMSLLSPDGLTSPELLFYGTQALDGQGTIRFDAGKKNKISASAGTLTIGPDIVIDKVSAISAQVGSSDAGLVNYGLIKAGSFGGLTITGQNWVNYGTIELGQGGNLSLSGTMRNSTLGTIVNHGGEILLRGTIDNAGQTLNLQGFGGSFSLAGGTIRGGTLGGTSPLELLVSTLEGYLDGVTVDADLNLQYAWPLWITNGLTLNDRKISLVSGASLNFRGAQTLGGTGELIVHGRPDSSGYTTSLSGSGLVIGPNITIRTGDYTHGSLAIRIGGDGSVNQGTIVADKGVVEIEGAGWVNQGVIQHSGGWLNLNGSFTTAAIGNLVHTGGDVTIRGVLDNTGETLRLYASDGRWCLDGTIIGGTVATADGEQLCVDVDDRGLLRNVTLTGETSIARAGELQIEGSLLLKGATIRMSSSSSTSNPTEVILPGGQTIGDQGEIVFDGPGSNNWIHLRTGNNLTIGKNVTLRTDTGGGKIGTKGLLVTNEGTISAQTAGQEIQITGQFANPGVMRATFGTLNVDSPDWTNRGLIQLLFGTLQVTASLLTNGSDARIEGSGTLLGSGTTFVSDGIVAPGMPFPSNDVTGRLAFVGDFRQTSQGLLSLDVLRPTGRSGFDSVTVTRNAQLAGKLEVRLLPEAHFTYGDWLDILRANPVTGRFDEVVLPTFPDGKPMFSLAYWPDRVRLTYVPEPAGFTLAAVGLMLLLGFLWRRGAGI